MIFDAFWDALLDSLRALPFLIAAFALMEILEKHQDRWIDHVFGRIGRSGPLIGAVTGLVPQCGFSAAMSNLYAGGVVSLGTLMAVFLATSDEAVLIMLSEPKAIPMIIPLLATKFVIALIFGFLTDAVIGRQDIHEHIHDICIDCGCRNQSGILKPALIHTGRVFGWLLVISFVLNVVLEYIGSDRLAGLLGAGTVFQPLMTALIGLIPNCAVSVMFTKLYIAGSLSFASAIAGLSSGAGLGLIVLCRMNKDKRDTLKIAVLLYAFAAISGVVLWVIGLSR